MWFQSFLFESGMGGRGIIVIAFHDAVAACADLADLAIRDDLAGLGIDDLEFRMRECTPDGGDPPISGSWVVVIVTPGLVFGWQSDHDLAHVQVRVDLLDHLNGEGGRP